MSASYRSPVVRAGGMVLTVLLLAGLAMAPARAAGGTFFTTGPGTGAPPSTLGPYTMTPFGPDGRALFSDVTSVPAPGGGSLGFDRELALARANDGGWSTWSHGYAGDIYWVPAQRFVMALPPSTYAFYFYAQSTTANLDGTPREELIRATAQDGTSSGPVGVVSMGGASYFGFYSTGAPLTSIAVEMVDVVGFAVGEFGIYTGSPAEEPTEPTPPPARARADVAAVIYGGWEGIPVKAYVGGTEQETLYTAHDAFGRQTVLWTFYPPANASWQVLVAPQLPAGLDPARWQYRLVYIESNKLGVKDPTSATASIWRCSEHIFHFQLVDTGAQ